LAALCVAQLGIWHHDPVLEKESSQLYGSAVGELRKTIGCQKLLAPVATLAGTVILATYELFLGPWGQNSGWVSHVRGGCRILELLGRGVYETPAGRLLFAKMRTISIIEAFRNRRASIMAGLEWQGSANEHDSHDLSCHLQDLMIQLPSIMEALDTVAASTNKLVETSVVMRLLERCSSLNAQLLAWNEKLKTEVHGSLHWTVPSEAESPADDPVLGRIFPFAFQFPSLNIALLLLLYWSTLILLHRTTQDIQKILKRQTTSGTVMHSIGLQDRGRNELFSEYSYPSDDRIALLANNICQSLEYCSSTKNGTLGPQSTMFALWVAQNFYESQSDRDRELAWCTELGNTTAPDSRFDLYVMKPSGNGEVCARGSRGDIMLN